ncbi:hypothetical protein FPV67DRAFT_1768210 [Lyophyllum atratum]|nr:hypothetical protein FPV67DRAFT_1768210 [Lyophyllum atratum]
MRVSSSVVAVSSLAALLLPCVAAVKPFPRFKATENAKSRAKANSATSQRRSLRFTALARAKVSCEINESICGVVGHENTEEYQCLDTSTNVESCGGCITPHPFYEPYRATSVGVQCTRLPGVITAQCRESRCVVSQCSKGFQPSPDKTRCVAIPSTTERLLVNTVLSFLRFTGGKRQTGITELPPVLPPPGVDPSSIKEKVSALANSTLQLKAAATNILGDPSNVTSLATPPGGIPMAPNSTLIDPIVQALISLVASSNASTAVSSIASLVTSNAAVANTLSALPSPPIPNIPNTLPSPPTANILNTLPSPPTGPETLLSLLDVVGKAGLDLKNTPDLENKLNSEVPFGLVMVLADLVGVLNVPGSKLDLRGKVIELVKLVLGLQAQTAALQTLQPSLPSVPSPGLPGGQNLLSTVVRAVAQLLGARGLGDVLKNVEALAGATTVLENALKGCGCVTALGLGEVVKGVGELGEKVVALKGFVEENKDVGVPDGVPVVADAEVLQQALGVKPDDVLPA